MEEIYNFLKSLEKGEHILKVECTKEGKELPYAVYFILGEVKKEDEKVFVHHSEDPKHKVIGYANFGGNIDKIDYTEERIKKNIDLFTELNKKPKISRFGSLDKIIYEENGKIREIKTEPIEEDKIFTVLSYNWYIGKAAMKKTKLE